MTTTGVHEPPTQLQLDYVAGLQRKLRLSDYMLDNWCVWTYHKRWSQMSKRDVSSLIDTIKDWKALPDRMLRAMGQQDLPGIGDR